RYTAPSRLPSFPTRRSSDLVERQVGDDTAADELAEQGSQADLDDVPAEHRDDAAAAGGPRELPGEGAEVLCGEDVREGIPEGGEDRKSTRLNSSHVSISYAV